jgi:hypothetical protein
MIVENLFDYCIETSGCQDTTFCVGDNCGNSVLMAAIKDKHIYTYSNEWLHLIKFYYPNCNYYNEFIKFFNNLDNLPIVHLPVDAFSLITCFTRGTTHGYTGFYEFLYQYIINYEKHKDKKLLLSNKTDQGMKDIINHLCNKKIIDETNIIYLEDNVRYHFKSIEILKNNYHIYCGDLLFHLDYIIEKYIIPDTPPDFKYLDKIGVIKSDKTFNLTNQGVFDYASVILFSKKWNINLISPDEIGEVLLIRYLHYCKVFITTYGTAFFKNYVYINKCEKIIVLVHGDHISQYEREKEYSSLLLNYKNATIQYKIVNDLNFELYE